MMKCNTLSLGYGSDETENFVVQSRDVDRQQSLKNLQENLSRNSVGVTSFDIQYVGDTNSSDANYRVT